MFGNKTIKILKDEIDRLREQNKMLIDQLLAFNERVFWTVKQGDAMTASNSQSTQSDDSVQKDLEVIYAN